MIEAIDYPLLKSVSRSFYLSLKWLPAPMRPATCLAYLLARLSDTIADAPGLPIQARLDGLCEFSDALRHGTSTQFSPSFLNHISSPSEQHLLIQAPTLLQSLVKFPPTQQALMTNVLNTIISGQTLDVQRFAEASPSNIICLPTLDALDDYTWRVAGCVGEFWTKLAHLTLTADFSSSPLATLIPQAIHLGKALQLINILRDLPADLALGRCYLPVTTPTCTATLMQAFHQQIPTIHLHLQDAKPYAQSIHSRRLRTASYLPALLAQQTLPLLTNATWDSLSTRLKIPRSTVYRCLISSFCLNHQSSF